MLPRQPDQEADFFLNNPTEATVLANYEWLCRSCHLNVLIDGQTHKK